MIPKNIIELIEENSVCGIKKGDAIEFVRSQLGEPDKNSLSKKPVFILSYGKVEFSFYEGKVFGIGVDSSSFHISICDIKNI